MRRSVFITTDLGHSFRITLVFTRMTGEILAIGVLSRRAVRNLFDKWALI